MPQWILISIGSGIASSLLYLSLTTGNIGAAFLFYLGTLPLFIAGLGWGVTSAALAGVIAALLVMTAGGPQATFLHLFIIGLPVVLLVYLSSRSRPIDTSDPQSPQVFYPVGRLILWIALIAASITALSIIIFSGSLNTYQQTLTELFKALLQDAPSQSTLPMPDPINMDTLVAFFVRLLPIIGACLWMITTLLCFWLAGRIVQMSGYLQRPWPNFSQITYPHQAVYGFALAIALTFTPGFFGFLAEIFAATFALAFAILGLAVVHTLSIGMKIRPALLVITYLLLIFVGWLIIIFIGLGLAETLLGLRMRTQHGPPTLPPTTSKE